MGNAGYYIIWLLIILIRSSEIICNPMRYSTTCVDDTIFVFLPMGKMSICGNILRFVINLFQFVLFHSTAYIFIKMGRGRGVEVDPLKFIRRYRVMKGLSNRSHFSNIKGFVDIWNPSVRKLWLVFDNPFIALCYMHILI